MALFQLLLKEDSESTEVYCVLIVTDYGTCVTLFFKVQVLDCVFRLNYGGAVPSVNWDVTCAVRSVYAGEIKKKKKDRRSGSDTPHHPYFFNIISLVHCTAPLICPFLSVCPS